MTTTRQRDLIKAGIASAILPVLTLGTFWAGHCWPCGKGSEWFNVETMVLAMFSMSFAGMAFGLLRMFTFKHIASALIANAIIVILLIDLLVPFLPNHPSSQIQPGAARMILIVMSFVFLVVWSIVSTIFRSRRNSTSDCPATRFSRQ